jgi:SAM-dependent methyltransferase
MATKPVTRQTDWQEATNSDELEAIYEQPFSEHITYRKQVWKVLVSQFFSRFVRRDDGVLDLGCGYGEFINQVRLRQEVRYRSKLKSTAISV